jgi:regulatory protein
MGPRRTRAEPESGEPQAGTVTSLVLKGNDGDRCAVYIEGRLAFDLATALVKESSLVCGQFLAVDRQTDLLEKDQPYRARSMALATLARRARCRCEVERKLRKSGFEQHVIECTLAWLEARGYVDDRRYAAAYAAERLKSGWSRQRIVAELTQKGIPRELLHGDMWDGLVSDTDGARDTEWLVALVERRFGRQLMDDPDRARRRIKGFLTRRGHDWEEITRISRLVSERLAAQRQESGDAQEGKRSPVW